MSNPLLDGVRILDLTRLLPGPFCTQYLAQLGAEVIKIEDPAGGDYARELMPALFAVVNRGKHSVTLDLREAEDVEAFKALVKTADVVVESFRPGVMDRLGCGYDTLEAVNPKLVYAAITGYGQDGPYRDAAGHDLNYLAYAGVLDQTGAAGGAPTMSNVQIADLAGGALTAATGILAALLGARISGEGTFVDSSMLDGSLALQPIALAGLRSRGHTQKRGADMLTGALPNYQVYKCRDGRYLAVGALEPKFFARLLTALGEQVPLPTTLRNLMAGKSSGRREGTAPAGNAAGGDGTKKPGLRDRLNEILEDPARARRWLTPVRWSLAGVFRLRSRDAWMQALAEADACIAPVLTLEEALADPQVLARGMLERADGGPAFGCPLHFEGTRRDPLAPAPGLGDDNDWLLER